MVEFARGFKTKANRIALGLRKQAGVPATAPLDPRDVLHRLSIPVVPLTDFQDQCPGGVAALRSPSGSFSAMLVAIGRSERIVVHNDAHSWNRQRSNLAHELAHVLLVHPAEVVCTGDLSRRADSLVEAEAAYLGGCILVPNEAAHRLAYNGVDVATAARVYGVSEDMVRYRLSVSGALKRVRRVA
ncbi:MAG: ImmA/IrrE family metallo-endopeptidase [Chloroflexi bacterium]|nr:ImmA/IrrE family metallo-endopeptidase [Chloroflexota bacterium]